MTLYGTLTIFMFVHYPTTDPDYNINMGTNAPKYGRKALYRAYSLTREEAEKQVISFTEKNQHRLNRKDIYAKWQADPVELEIV